MIDLPIDQFELVKEILREHVPDMEIWAFGSRVKGNAKRYSDLDLAVINETPLPLLTMALLESDFSESDLPIKVEILEWATTSESFRQIIKENYQIIQPAKST